MDNNDTTTTTSQPIPDHALPTLVNDQQEMPRIELPGGGWIQLSETAPGTPGMCLAMRDPAAMRQQDGVILELEPEQWRMLADQLGYLTRHAYDFWGGEKCDGACRRHECGPSLDDQGRD